MAIGRSLKQHDWTQASARQPKSIALEYEGELPKPTRDMVQIHADLGNAGYAIFESALTVAQAIEFRNILDEEIRREEIQDESTVRRFYTDSDDKNRRLSRLPNRHKWFRDLLEHPLALELTRHIVGPQLMNESYLVHSYGANVTHPGSAAQMIHRDRGVVQPFVRQALQSRFIWCLDDFTEENGATRMVPGSHAWGAEHWIDMTGASVYESVPAEAPRGSLIVYTDCILHGAGANRSQDSSRAGVIAGYCPPWYRPMINFPLVLDPQVMLDTSVTLRQLLGYSSVHIGFDEPWNGAPAEIRDLTVSPTMTW